MLVKFKCLTPSLLLADDYQLYQVERQGRDSNNLSGGERSKEQLLLLISLWRSVASPVRILDEYTVSSLNLMQLLYILTFSFIGIRRCRNTKSYAQCYAQKCYDSFSELSIYPNFTPPIFTHCRTSENCT